VRRADSGDGRSQVISWAGQSQVMGGAKDTVGRVGVAGSEMTGQ